MIALDTNLLVYAHREDSEFHGPAKAIIETLRQQAAPWAILPSPTGEGGDAHSRRPRVPSGWFMVPSPVRNSEPSTAHGD